MTLVVTHEAVQSAAEAMAATGTADLKTLAEAALEAAAPVLEAAERERSHADRIVAAIFACPSKDCPRPFALYRQQDVTGVSGTGTVAHGVQFADGRVVIRWLGGKPSTVIWDSLDDAMSVHGHDGKTQVVWVAADFSEMGKAEKEAAAAERERIRQIAIEHRAAIAVEGDWSTLIPFADLLEPLPEMTP